MLITPDVEQITPVSAPSMIGIESSSVPDSRFTTLNGIDWPASDQASSAMTNSEEHDPDDDPARHPAERDDAQRREQPHDAPAAA